MADRPKRERKPTQHFMYHESTSTGNVGTVASGPAKKTSGKKSKANATSTKTVSSAIGKGRVRGTAGGRGRGRGQIGSQRGSHGRLSSGRSVFASVAEQEASDHLGSSSDAIEDTGALQSDITDYDSEADEQLFRTTKDSSSRKSKEAATHGKILATEPLAHNPANDIDEQIEQWYEDPYERINPDGPTYDQWRYNNLETNLHKQGFALTNSRDIAAWLMKCNGQFAEYNVPIRKPRKSRVKQKPTQAVMDVQDRLCQESAAQDTLMHQSDKEEETVPKTVQTPAEALYAAFKLAMQPRTRRADNMTSADEQDDTVQALNGESPSLRDEDLRSYLRSSSVISEEDGEEIANEESAVESVTGVEELEEDSDSEDSAKERELEDLRRSLAVYHAVYGSDGPQANPEQFEDNYLSRQSVLPVLRPKAGLRTQGHYELQEVLLPVDNPAFSNGPERDGPSKNDQAKGIEFYKVLTEDPTFGLTWIPESERCTKDELKAYYASFEPKENEAAAVDADEGDDSTTGSRAHPAIRLSQAQQEPIMPFRAIDPALLRQQLLLPVFEWETASTMAGLTPGANKNDRLPVGAFAYKERHTWKEVRARRAILDRGGDEAAKMLEQERETARIERRRAARREESKRFRARRKAAREGKAVADENKIMVRSRRKGKERARSEEMDEDEQE